MGTFTDLDVKSINTIRGLSIDAIDKANSGHPGLPLGAAPMAYVLWSKHLRHSPSHPNWPDRDRFVLSAGHGSMLLYSLLHLFGYDLSLDEIKNFRQWKSKTPGHPEAFLTPGVEATTGPLGQGAANAIGMAIAERKLAHLFNRPGFEIVNHHTYALVGDGDLMEGVVAEAASLAGHLRLGKLTFLYDSNHISLDGPTTLTFSTENVGKRFESYGWHVIYVKDGNSDLKSIDLALQEAKREHERPSLIIVETTIGFGSPNRKGTSGVHGSPLGAAESKLTKEALGLDPDQSFEVSGDVQAHFQKFSSTCESHRKEWQGLLERYHREFPKEAELWETIQKGELPKGWDQDFPTFKPGDDQATRKASGSVVNAIAAHTPHFFGGDADLGCSTLTVIAGGGSFKGSTGTGKNIHYGVREHAMAAIANGIAYHGGLRSFVATFFCFADYMRPSIRLAAMNHLPVTYVWTHDSIGLGEDGPTHQPVEHLMSLRTMPNMTIIRPCDANETAEAWKLAMEFKTGPVGLVLSRQKTKTLDRVGLGSAKELAKGAYILKKEAKSSQLDLILISTGSEVAACLSAAAKLEADGKSVRVVSMPSWELFRAQSQSYRDGVLPPKCASRISVEAGVTWGWEAWVGSCGISLGLNRFGASAPDGILLKEFGLDADGIYRSAQEYLRAPKASV